MDWNIPSELEFEILGISGFPYLLLISSFLLVRMMEC